MNVQIDDDQALLMSVTEQIDGYLLRTAAHMTIALLR